MAVSKNRYKIPNYNISGIFTKQGYTWVNVHKRYIIKDGKVFYLVHERV